MSAYDRRTNEETFLMCKEAVLTRPSRTGQWLRSEISAMASMGLTPMQMHTIVGLASGLPESLNNWSHQDLSIPDELRVM
jgi:hypothetical protein